MKALALCLLLFVPGAASAQTLYSGVPVARDDRSVAAFSDLGAWHGYATPPDERIDLAGGFVGPLLFDDGVWLSEQLLRFVPEFEENPGLAGVSNKVLPGRLEQLIDFKNWRVVVTLHYESAERAVLHAAVTNLSEESIRIRPKWQGSVYPRGRVREGTDGISVRTPGGDRIHVIAAGTKPKIDGRAFELRGERNISVRAGQTRRFAAAITLGPQASFADDIDISVSGRDARWDGYLAALDSGRYPNHPQQVLVEKALMTLTSNWRSPRGALTTDGLFPSSSAWYFNGFWAWDSWKHAVALARFDTDLAKKQVRSMFEHQNDAGMIADVVYADPSENNWRDTKPPLSGWAVAEIAKIDPDLDFVAEMYPKIMRYHDWWYRERDHDGDGLCEYGSTDGTLEAARWESGMDNAVRFDNTLMLETSKTAWSMDQESVDLNAYLYREKLALAELARLLGREGDALILEQKARDLGAKIREVMYDEETGWFYDTRIDGSGLIKVQGPEGWIPLWAGVATPAQAALVRKSMLDPERFYTHVPFPTVSAQHPEFSEGYWRGLVWLDQAWFAIEGLRRYGYTEDATMAGRDLLRNLHGATQRDVPLRENYSALTGEGRNARHFSWTAAHLLLLALEHRNEWENERVSSINVLPPREMFDVDNPAWEIALDRTWRAEQSIESNYVVDLRRSVIDIPEDWHGRRVVLSFSGVRSSMFAWVNGKRAGYSERSGSAVEMDVTDLIEPGMENIIELEIMYSTRGQYLNIPDLRRNPGRAPPVTIAAWPHNGFDDIATKITPEGLLQFKAEIAGRPSSVISWRLLDGSNEILAGEAIKNRTMLARIPAGVLHAAQSTLTLELTLQDMDGEYVQSVRVEIDTTDYTIPESEIPFFGWRGIR